MSEFHYEGKVQEEISSSGFIIATKNAMIIRVVAWRLRSWKVSG